MAASSSLRPPSWCSTQGSSTSIGRGYYPAGPGGTRPWSWRSPPPCTRHISSSHGRTQASVLSRLHSLPNFLPSILAVKWHIWNSTVKIQFHCVHCEKLGFFSLHLVHQDASFELSKKKFGHFFIFFYYKGVPFWFRGGQNLLALKLEKLEKKEKQY